MTEDPDELLAAMLAVAPDAAALDRLAEMAGDDEEEEDDADVQESAGPKGPPPHPGLVFDAARHRWVRPSQASEKKAGGQHMAHDNRQEAEKAVLPDGDGTSPNTVWRVQPRGAGLHDQQSTDSNDDYIDGVFVFDNLNELASIDWLNEKDVELVRVRVAKGDTFKTSDQEGVGLKSGRGEVVASLPFDSIRDVRGWASTSQKAGWKPVIGKGE